MTHKRKHRPYEIDADERNERRRALRRVKRVDVMRRADGNEIEVKREVETCAEDAEGRQLVAEMARAFAATIEHYKSEYAGAKPHDEAVKAALSMNESRRQWVAGLEPEKVGWSHLAAVGEHSLPDALSLWGRVRDAAEDELTSGRRAAQVAGDNIGPYERAQFLAIRDAFADQWQPQGGIESAMIDMMTVAFSLQMYWSTIAHQRATRGHDEQRKELQRYESNGWKSPYQHEAGAIEQAHRLADGYNRQFLRVLRQLRDLRRYAPVVIQNHGGQVNVATDGGQQVNVTK